MSVLKQTSKSEKQMAVSLAVLEIIEQDGLAAVTHSKVARRSKVSRAWIYEYIGQNKLAFIEFAAETMAQYFSRIELNLPTNNEDLQKKLSEGVDFLFNSTMQNPVIVKLYFRYRGTSNPIGNVISKYEKKWLALALKSATKTLGLAQPEAELFVETALMIRLAFAHRVVTSNKPYEARQKAEQVFNYAHHLMEHIKI